MALRREREKIAMNSARNYVINGLRGPSGVGKFASQKQGSGAVREQSGGAGKTAGRGTTRGGTGSKK
jgi:hypothetical protein